MSKEILNSVCVIYDEVADTYSAPMTFANDAAAIRFLKVKGNDPFIKNYKLYKIADYDPFIAKLYLIAEPQLLLRGDQIEEANA